jgi:hypothetical protein
MSWPRHISKIRILDIGKKLTSVSILEVLTYCKAQSDIVHHRYLNERPPMLIIYYITLRDILLSVGIRLRRAVLQPVAPQG